MTVVLAAVLAGAFADDEAILKQAEAWTEDQLRGHFYLARARAGIPIIKDLLRGGNPPPDQLREMEAMRRELEEIFAAYDPARPDPTVARLMLSANPKVAEEGGKALLYGDFPDALAEVRRRKPEIVQLIKRERARKAASRPPTEPDVLREHLLDLLRRVLGDMKKSPNSSMGESYFASATNAYFGENMKAWETWLNRNEKFLGALPGVRTFETGEGVLHVDEEAKAAGVPWLEWRTLTAEDRAGRLGNKKVAGGWKHVQVVLRVSEESVIGRPDGFGSLPSELDLSPDSPHLVYWLLLLRRELTKVAPGWDLRIRLLGAQKPVRTMAARCEKLGFQVKIGLDAN